MHCARAREMIAGANSRRELEAEKTLAEHVSDCPSCRRVMDQHAALLDTLGTPAPLPLFRDLAPEVLDQLPGGSPAWWVVRRWATAAALAVLMLATGYLMGARLLGHQAAPNAITATYQEAFSGASSGSVESAYLAGGTLPARYTHGGTRP